MTKNDIYLSVIAFGLTLICFIVAVILSLQVRPRKYFTANQLTNCRPGKETMECDIVPDSKMKTFK